MKSTVRGHAICDLRSPQNAHAGIPSVPKPKHACSSLSLSKWGYGRKFKHGHVLIRQLGRDTRWSVIYGYSCTLPPIKTAAALGRSQNEDCMHARYSAPGALCGSKTWVIYGYFLMLSVLSFQRRPFMSSSCTTVLLALKSTTLYTPFSNRLPSFVGLLMRSMA